MGRPHRLAEDRALQAHQQRAEADQQPEGGQQGKPRLAGEGRGQDQELAGEDAERRHAADRQHGQRERHGEPRMGDAQPRDLGDALGPLGLGDMADGEEDAGLGQAVHRHVQQAGEIGERPAHAEGEHDQAHVLDRRVGEQPLDVAALVQHEGGEDQRHQPHHDHDRAGIERRRLAGHDHLEAQQRIERDVQQQARENRRDRRRSLGMGIGQPGMQRRQPDLGAVADQQEDEGEVEDRRIHARGGRLQQAPGHRRHALAQRRLAGEVDQDGAEEGERYADAGQDEVFPRRLDRLRRAIEPDHDHGDQRRQLQPDPHHADIVGDAGRRSSSPSWPGTWRGKIARSSAAAGRSRSRGRCRRR